MLRHSGVRRSIPSDLAGSDLLSVDTRANERTFRVRPEEHNDDNGQRRTHVIFMDQNAPQKLVAQQKGILRSKYSSSTSFNHAAYLSYFRLKGIKSSQVGCQRIPGVPWTRQLNILWSLLDARTPFLTIHIPGLSLAFIMFSCIYLSVSAI